MKRTTTWGLALVCLAVSGLVIGCEDKPAGPAGPGATTQPAGGGGATTQPAGGGGTVKKRGTIGLSVLTLSNPFFQEIADALEAEVAKSGYDVILVSGDNDASKQRTQVQQFISRKCAAIVLTPCNSRSVGAAIKDANDAGIPVFTADIACLDKSADVVSHIATDNYGGGKMAAQAIVEALKARGGAKGEIAIIDYDEVESVKQRTDGFLTRLADENKADDVDLTLVARLTGKGRRDMGREAMAAILQTHPRIKAVFAINDPSALGAVEAMEAVSNSRVVVVGFDGQLDGKQAIKEGKIYADPIQFPKEIGRLAGKAIVDNFYGRKVAAETLIPTALYRKADADKDADLK